MISGQWGRQCGVLVSTPRRSIDEGEVGSVGAWLLAVGHHQVNTPRPVR